jgi:hypothetical protein
MTDEIDIPASAFEPKPWWDKRPSDERIQEILGFILRTSKPYLWVGQTYNKPPSDGPIDYLAEFYLPQSKPLVPCPCCTPRHPKYRHGMVAYFPDERVIRIMGHACFRAFNSEGHVEALKKYHGDLQRKKDIVYLLGNLDKVPDLIIAIEFAAPVGHAVDEIRNNACIVFKEVLRTNLWDHIRTGELRISTIKRQIFQIPGRGEDEREVSITETYGRIAGQDFLKARSPKLGLKLDNAVLALRQINFGSQFKDRVSEMSDSHRTVTARLLGKAVKAANEAFAAIHELRQFTSPATIAGLNGWARIAECPVQMHIAFDGSSLYIGKREHQYRRIEVPAAYTGVLRALPNISLTSVAA